MLFLIIDDNNIYLSDPDVGLMLEFQKGSNESFEALMDKHFSSILNFIYRMTGNKETAEDLTQEVFVKIYDHVKNYQPKSSFKTWAYVIAKNMTLNELRRPRNREIAIEDNAVDSAHNSQPEEQANQNEVAEAVKAAIQALPENQRIATILRRYEQLSYEEIAASMKTSEKAVKSLLNRAKESLRLKLSKFVEQ